MHFVYILYSNSADKYYVGETSNLEIRLDNHKSGFYSNAFTTIATDWGLFFKIECNDISQARKIEKHIKSMKSRKYILNLCSFPAISERLLNTYSS